VGEVALQQGSDLRANLGGGLAQPRENQFVGPQELELMLEVEGIEVQGGEHLQQLVLQRRLFRPAVSGTGPSEVPGSGFAFVSVGTVAWQRLTCARATTASSLA